MTPSPTLCLALFLVICFINSCCSLTCPNENWKVGQRVSTTSGILQGRATTVKEGVSTYLGIPYAKPPVGDLRFAAPERSEGCSLIDATHFGPSCPITTVFGDGSPPITEGKNLTKAGFKALETLYQSWSTISEDCLTLNIWTKPQSGEKKKAVMVWIHGGGFTVGTSSDPSFDGQFLAEEQDVVVVSFNYRLNIFGFPGSPHAPANLGLLDQRLAIEWVRDNIESFGGDTSRITLFGQSAGGGSIDLYSFAWTNDPIVSSLILQSPNPRTPYPAETAASSWFNVTKKLGCGGNETHAKTQMECMRKKTTEEITAAIPHENNPMGSAAFWPTIDEKIVFSDYPKRMAEGRFIKVPMLIGNTDNESGYFRAMSSLWNSSLPDEAWQYLAQAVFTCPVAERLNANVNHSLKTWRYRYFGEFEELKLTEQGEGAYHASEVLLIFGIVGIWGDERRDTMKVGRYLRDVWAAFAKDSKTSLLKLGWPVYKDEERTLARLGWQNRPGKHLVKGDSFDNCKG